MAGETLPPVVAVLQGDISDLVAKVAEAKSAVESLDSVTGTARADLDLASLEASLAEAEAMIRAFSSQSGNIEMTASINMAPAIAEFAAAAAAMRLAADTAGGGPGGGGLLALLGWGGGTFGFAAFGSVLSFAGLGFEHLAFMALGLAGSLAGALTGGALLAAGALSTMAVGMATDMAGMGQAIGDIQQYTTLSNNLAQAIAVYGKNSTEAALAQYQMNQWMKDLSPATVVAIKAAANTASAFHAMFDQVTAQAETTGAQIINTLMLLGEKFLPIIGQFAAQNMAIIQSALVPLEDWLAGPGLTIFTEMEQMFQNELPYAMKAFDNGVELVIKVLGYLSSQGGGFIQWLATFFAKWNSAGEWPTVVKGINTLIGLWHTWWDLLKTVAGTIYDVFSKTVGLGTTIVKTVTDMLKKLDQWIQSVQGTASLHNLFEAHLQEIQAILNLLPSVLGGLGQLYLIIAPDLTKILTFIVNIANAVVRLPIGPWVVMAGAVLLVLNRMKLLQLATAAFSGIKNVISLFQALNNGASWKDAISIAFGSQSSLAQFQTSVGEFADAVMKFAGTTGVGDATGGAGAAGGAAGEGGILGELGTFGSDLAMVAGPLAALPAAILGLVAVVNALPHTTSPSPVAQGAGTGGNLSGLAKIQNAYVATWQALLDSSNAAYKTSGLFQQNLQTDLTAAGIPLAKLGTDTALIESAFASGKIKTQAQLAAMIRSLAGTDVSTAMTAAQTSAMAVLTSASHTLVGERLSKVGTNLLVWQDALENTGVSATIASGAEKALSNFIAVHGPVTANEMGIFQNMATNTQLSSAQMSSVMNTVATFVKTHGPLTTSQMLGIQDALADGVTSASGINKALSLTQANLNPGIAAATAISNELIHLRGTIPSSFGIRTQGGIAGFTGYATGGEANFPETGGLAMLHGHEMVVPYEKAGWLWPFMAAAVAGGKPPTATPGPMPSVGLALPRGGGGGGASLAPQYNTTINIPGGANLSPQTIAAAVAQGLAQHDNDLMRQMGASPRVGAMR